MIDWHAQELIEEVDATADEIAEDGAIMVAASARALCAVDDGTLRGSIRVEKSRFANGGHMVVAGGQGAWGDAYYMPFIELGTPGTTARVDTGGGRRGRIGTRRKVDRRPVKAQPFMRPALEMNKARIRRRYEGALK